MSDDGERGRGMMVLMPNLAERWKCPREDGQALGCVWVLEKRKPALVVFKPGATDRSMTQGIPLKQSCPAGAVCHGCATTKHSTTLQRELALDVEVIVDSEAPQSAAY